MSLTAAEQAIYAEVERARLAWTAYTLNVELPGQSYVELSEQTDPYLMFDIEWRRGAELDLGDAPLIEDSGQIVLAAGVKEGRGDQLLTPLLEHFRPYLQRRDLSAGVRTRIGQLYPTVTAKGFVYRPMIIDFWVVSVIAVVP